MLNNDFRTTVVVKNSTKARMSEKKAPQQSYEKYICQLMDFWDEKQQEHISGDSIRLNPVKRSEVIGVS